MKDELATDRELIDRARDGIAAAIQAELDGIDALMRVAVRLDMPLNRQAAAHIWEDCTDNVRAFIMRAGSPP